MKKPPRTSMVSGERYSALVLDRDQLKARVNRLLYVITECHQQICDNEYIDDLVDEAISRNPAASLNSIKALMLERDGLAARVAELEEVMRDEFTGHPPRCPAWYGQYDDPNECTCDARIAVEVLSRKPLQSLNSIKAQALEAFAKDLQCLHTDSGDLHADMALLAANNLRSEDKG